jgi:hypothetical protein
MVVLGRGKEPAEELGSAWRRKTTSKEELILSVFVASFQNTSEARELG